MSDPAADDREALAQLLRQVADGDRQAFADLYQRTSSKVFGVLLRMLHDRGTAEEVLQDTYITVWHRADRFDAARASAITWIVTVGRNKAIDHMRKHRESLYDDPSRLNEVVDEDASMLEKASASQDHQRLTNCLDGLETRERKVVREAFFSGTTYKQLAAHAEVPLGTMKSWIRRSLIQLRACLEH